MFPKKGKIFPDGNDRERRSHACAGLVAEALERELGGSHRATKTVMNWTGASARTVKGWLAGLRAPSADYLLILMQESDAVFEILATRAGRQGAISAARFLAAHAAAVESIILLEPRATAACHPTSAPDALPPAASQVHTGRMDDRTDGRMDDTMAKPRSADASDGLNRRQRWFLEALGANADLRAADLQQLWGVSERTARRDLALLTNRGLIGHFGGRRVGRYRQAD